MASQEPQQGSTLLERLSKYHAATCEMDFDSRLGLAALVFPDGHAALAEELGALLGAGAVPAEQGYTAAAVLAAVQSPGTATHADVWLRLLETDAWDEAQLARVCETAAARLTRRARREVLAWLLAGTLPVQLPVPAGVRLAGCLVGGDTDAELHGAAALTPPLLALADDALERGDEQARRALVQGLLPAMLGMQECRVETAAWLSTLCRRVC